MSELKEMLKRHYEEEKELRKNCKHPEEMIKVYEDHSVVGRGCGVPSVHIICKNCGTMKIIFRDYNEMKTEIKKTFKIQKGFKDQRFSYTTNENCLE